MNQRDRRSLIFFILFMTLLFLLLTWPVIWFGIIKPNM